MKSEKVVKTAYIGLHLFYMAEVCMVSGFAVLFLTSRGLNNTLSGAAVALARLLSIIALTPISRKLDTNKALLKMLFPLTAALLLLFHIALALASFSVSITFLIFAATSFFSALCSSLTVILYSDLHYRGYEINYGLSRGLGSFSYTIVSFFAGKIIAGLTPECIPIISIAVSFGFLCTTAYICSVLDSNRTNTEGSDQADEKLFCYIRRRNGFSLFFAGILLVYVAYISCNSFAINLIQTIGGSAKELGVYNAMGAMFEVPFMIIFSRISVKNSQVFLRLSLLLMTIKVLLLALSRNIYWVYSAAVLQGASFGLYTPSIVNYIKINTSFDNSAKGQAVALIASSLGSVFGMLISGRMLDILPVRLVLMIMMAVSVIGSVTVWQAMLMISDEA